VDGYLIDESAEDSYAAPLTFCSVRAGNVRGDKTNDSWDSDGISSRSTSPFVKSTGADERSEGLAAV